MTQRRNMTMAEFERELELDPFNGIFHIDFMSDSDEVVTPEQQDEYKEQIAKFINPHQTKEENKND